MKIHYCQRCCIADRDTLEGSLVRRDHMLICTMCDHALEEKRRKAKRFFARRFASTKAEA